MISPHTPPGTRVVCILGDGENMLVEGRVYVLAEIAMIELLFGLVQIPVAMVHGVQCTCGNHLARWQLGHFDIAALPESLTKQLDAKPVDVPGLVTVP